MRNRLIMPVVAAAGLLGLIGGTVIANAGTDIPSPETITTVATVAKEKFDDVGKPGFSFGDTFSSVLDIKSPTGSDLGIEGRSARTGWVCGPFALARSTSPAAARLS
jgi:hypothetical protein